MKNIAIDTNAYAAFKCGDRNVLEILQCADAIFVSTIVIGELLAGFAFGDREKKNKKELEDFLDSSRCQIVSVDENTPLYYAQIYKMLRKKGKPIPSNDLWIAALTMQHGHILCTLDSHFSHVDGLLVCAS